MACRARRPVSFVRSDMGAILSLSAIDELLRAPGFYGRRCNNNQCDSSHGRKLSMTQPEGDPIAEEPQGQRVERPKPRHGESVSGCPRSYVAVTSCQ